MPLTDIVVVNVSTTGSGVTQDGFGVPLIMSHTAAWLERTRSYSSLLGVASDFAATTPEYLAAQEIFSQEPKVPLIMIGRAANVPTQRFAIGVFAVAVAALYKARIAAPSGGAWTSQDFSYTSVASAAWIALTAYVTGQLVTNDTGKLYICITAGTSAGSGGPTGTNANITDGTVHWMYAGAGGAGVSCNDAIVYNLQKALDALATPAVSGAGAHQITSSLQGSVGSKTLRILANTAGDFYGLQVYSRAALTLAQDHADPGVSTDLDAIALESTAWYGLITLYNSEAFVGAVAAWVESNEKLYDAATCDTACARVAESIATDVAHDIKAAAYARTHVFFHPSNDDFADAAEMGRFFPLNPGSDNWRLKTLAGITVETYTETEKTNLKAKYAGFYYDIGGKNVIGGDGKVGANEYVDVIRGLDWYKARLRARLANLLIQNNKVPFTDPGIDKIEAEVRAQNEEGINAGLIAADPPPTVLAPKAADVSSADRQNRELNGVTSAWQLAGAINKLTVNVTATA